MVDAILGAADPVDPESAEWLGALASRGSQREAALARLHDLVAVDIHDRGELAGQSGGGR